LTAMDDVHEGNLAESVINTLQRSSPWFHPQWLYQHFVKSTCKFPKKINLSIIYDNSQLPFMSQHYVKSTCKFQRRCWQEVGPSMQWTDVSVKTTHKIWKKGSRKDDSQVPKKPSFLEHLTWVNFFGRFHKQ
jgi:hypothetical protein